MPLLTSSYRAPWLLRNGHAATILPALLPGPRPVWTDHERLELPDGDFLELSWSRQPPGGRKSGPGPQAAAPRLAVLCHGLEGSVDSGYIRSLAATLHLRGWEVLAWNCRGCGGIPNRLPRSYHSGETGDLRHVIHHAARTCRHIALAGFSLGGNLVLKYAGESPPHAAVRAAAAVSAPVDLSSSAQALDERPGNAFYRRRFLRTLLHKASAKARQFPGTLDTGRLAGIRSIRAFDEAVTAPLHGFRDAADYYARSSSLPLLEKLTIPALLLNARNDPLLAPPSYPAASAACSALLHLEMPAHGGHVGFPSLSSAHVPAWHILRMADFLDQAPFTP